MLMFVYVYIHEMWVSNVYNVLRAGSVCILYAGLWCEPKEARRRDELWPEESSDWSNTH